MGEKPRKIKVVHVHFKDSNKDEYFGSKAAIFSYHSPDEIGYSKSYLVGMRIPECIENKKVSIKIGELLCSPQQKDEQIFPEVPEK